MTAHLWSKCDIWEIPNSLCQWILQLHISRLICSTSITIFLEPKQVLNYGVEKQGTAQ